MSKKNMKNYEKSQGQEEQTLRRVIQGRRWRLFRHSTIGSQGTTKNKVVFWDDSSLTEIWDEIDWFCGVEVHKEIIVCALYGIVGKNPVFGPIIRFDNTEAGFTVFFEELGKIQPKRYLMETTGIYHFKVAWWLKERVPEAQVIVMNAKQVSRLIRETRKSDSIDAQRLAQICRYEELITVSFVPNPEITMIRELVRHRERLVKENVKFKNRIRKLLDMFGFSWKFDFKVKRDIMLLVEFMQSKKRWGDLIEEKLKAGKVTETWIDKNDIHVWDGFTPSEDLKELVVFELRSLFIRNSELHLLEKRIIERSKTIPWLQEGLKYLKTLPGMELFSQIILLAEIGYIERFPTRGEFLSYSGIACTGGTSGVKVRGDKDEKIVKKDRPNPNHNPILKRTLVRAAASIMKQAGKEGGGDIYIYAARIKAQKQKYFKQVFKVAAKLGRKIFYCLKHGEAYNGFVEKGLTAKKKRVHSKKMKKRESKKKYIIKDRKNTRWEDVYGYLQELGVRTKVISEIQRLHVSTSLLKGVES